MKNITKAILGGIGAFVAGSAIYNKGKVDGVEACKNAAYKVIAEDTLDKKIKENKKKNKEESK